MAGANYMGGKRNAVRARTKDFASRLRKDHFGKQRLHLLGHNVFRNKPSSLDQNHKTKVIDLAHAQRDSTMQGHGRTYIPQLETPIHSGSQDLVSSRSKPSKLLDALDRLEPISFCAKKNRLLSLSDFAGLSYKSKEIPVIKSRACIPLTGVKRKANDSDVSPRENNAKRRHLPVENVTDGSSSTDLLPSPSPAVFPRRSENSKPPAWQTYSEPSDYDNTSSSHQNSECHIYEDTAHASLNEECSEDELIRWPGCDSLDQQSRILETYDHLGNTWQTHESADISNHAPIETPSVRLLEMSEEWRDMANHLRVVDSSRGQVPASHLGRLGVDFYIFPQLKACGSDRIVTPTKTTDSPSEELSETEFSPLIPKHTNLSVTRIPSANGLPFPFTSAACDNQTSESSIPAPPYAFPPVPINACSTDIELLEYDTQSDTQRSFNLAPPSDNAQVSTSASAHMNSPSSEDDALDNTLSFIVEEPSQAHMPTSPGSDWGTLYTDNLVGEETSTQSMAFHSASPCLNISCDPQMEGLDDSEHDPMDLVVSIVDTTLEAVEEDLGGGQQDIAIAEPENGSSSVARDVETVITEESSNEPEVDENTSIVMGQSVHSDNITANQIENPVAVSHDHTGPEAASRGSSVKATFVNYFQGDDVRPTGFIEGPLLFGVEDEEEGDED